MDFKSFFKNKLNIAFLCTTAVGLILLLISSFVSALMGVCVILFGVSCILAIFVVRWFKLAKDNSRALENIELSLEQAKAVARQEKSNKTQYVAIIFMLLVFSGFLIYTGLMMYV